VAEADGDVVALAGLLVTADGAEVEPVIVSSHWRSRGIGRMLVDFVVEVARNLGVRYLGTRPVARNIDAISFFAKIGFDTVGHVELFQDLSQSTETEWNCGLRLHGNDLKY
jgi:N-acetylglutamate synthase-like GNAT family acetyltransferase